MSTELPMNPFHSMDDWLRTKLTSAGWRPGVSRDNITGYPLTARTSGRTDFVATFDVPGINATRYSDRFEHVAELLIDELFGLCVKGDKGEVYDSTIEFITHNAIHYADEIIRLSRILNTKLVPIGESVGLAFLLASSRAQLYLLGYVASGVICLGDSFASGLKSKLRGERREFLKFTSQQDPLNQFNFK